MMSLRSFLALSAILSAILFLVIIEVILVYERFRTILEPLIAVIPLNPVVDMIIIITIFMGIVGLAFLLIFWWNIAYGE